ncbi:hypothetical protein [Ulvibacter litoralis]|uniref:PKD domain-containing protein n=1 Tax=Ulvibacter litoralis TaxID=227084 RepID=A0A1G7DLV8_9FLAO|nr:hypothetical protein [Ulvibacter litoralis]GHC42983.1 hypothetical protein GCM10008083_01560 [Ulvibacter litoralis]SDE52492.1 hypothetical protein SAMN05421855_1011057 [Ulvibacter litoralis]
MKKLVLLTLAIITLNSCLSNDEEFQPTLSFNIESGRTIASSEINITNTSTNQNGLYTWELSNGTATNSNGDYTWEVTSNNGTETFTTNNLSFYANYIGDYTITLKSNLFDLQIEETITTTRPQALVFDKVTLKDIPQDYSSLYFKILEIRLDGTTSYTYTSYTKHHVYSFFPENTEWDVDLTGHIIAINDGSNTNDIASYQVEFYDNNDNLVTKINAFGNTYFDTSEFKAGEEEFTTTSNGCAGCDYFEVIFDFSFN